MKKRLLILVPLIVLAGVAVWKIKFAPAAQTGNGLRIYGNVDIRETSLGFRVPGRLAEVLKDEGDRVKPGEVLARIDPAPFERELSEAKARVDAAHARLEMLVAGNRPQEIAQAKAIVRERETSLANAQRVYRRSADLFGSRAISVQERDDAQAHALEAEARLNSAREQLNLIEAGFREEEIARAKAELAGAQATLSAAELRLRDTELRSLSDGIVMTRAREAGSILQAGTTVLTLSLPRPVYVRAYISEPNLGKIHPGMPVRVFTDTRPSQPYHGKVGFISPRAEFTPKTVETPELRSSLVFRLRIVVEDADDGLRQGMPVTVDLGSEAPSQAEL